MHFLKYLAMFYLRYYELREQSIWCVYELNAERVRVCLEDKYPSIVFKAKRENAEIHWGDETGLRNDNMNGRSYAPKGKTPVQRIKGTPEKINMISKLPIEGRCVLCSVNKP